jgi:prolyl oligopeptidase
MLLVILLFAGAALYAQPPAAARAEFREMLHATELIDYYHWLENFDHPDSREWITAQDRYTRDVLAKIPGQEHLRKRMLQLAAADRISVPQRAGNRLFYRRTTAASAQPFECYREGVKGAEKIWLDPAEVPKDSGITRSMLAISPDGKMAAYVVRTSGQDEVEIRFREVDRLRDIPDTLTKALYAGVSFLPDGSGVFYGIRSRETGARIRFHKFGTAPEEDAMVFGDGFDSRVFLNGRVTRNGRWLVMTASRGWSQTDVYVKDLKANTPVSPLTSGLEAQFSATECGPDHLLLTTTWNAPRKRALMVDLNRAERSAWKEIIPQADDVLQSANCVGGRVYAQYMHNVRTRVRTFSPDGKALGDVPVPPGAVGGIVGRWDHEEGFFYFETLTTPFRVDLFHVKRGKTGVWFESKMAVNPSDFEVKQVWYTSKDGTKVPMSLVSKKGLVPGAKGPALLTGYGGFNVSMQPSFNPQAILWAEQGAVWAQPNLRGGSEFGEDWHRAGMLDKKQNVFDDFIAAAEWLIENGYTTPERLAISGASNGGLLVGAALTQRPDLFKAVYCGYPDLDMVRYYRYTRNNNPPALLEYGDGSNPAHFPFLRAWSPYERITEGERYPAVLLTTGEGDTRVPPQQAVKMAAKLQWANRSKNPILLRFYQKAGHAGGRGMQEAATDTAAEYAFLMEQVGIRIE